METIDITKPESKCLLDFTERRMKEKLGCIMFFSGETGRGKSTASLRFFEMWYERWFKERFPITHVCESLEQAVLLVQKFNRVGEGIMIEELSVLASRRDSLTIINKLWNKFIDMCRIKQAVIIANAPHKSFIDSHFAMMTQIWVNCLEIDFKKEVCIARPLWLQTSPHKNEPYKHHFLNNDGFEIDYCYFRKPQDPQLLKAYNQRKLQSFDDLSKEIVLRMQQNRLKKFKELGKKRMPLREAEAYELHLKGEIPEFAAERMKLSIQSYNRTLNRAKERLKMIEYDENVKEIEEKNNTRTRKDKNMLRRATS